MAELKFATTLLLPAAVLILLSVTIEAEEAKRCYWCGPLAEQVHRSQRAPSCEQELQETMCEKGYTHCAVVATSPPYAESRLCVKFYQDECFSLYCNSSKAWRMICPCQGNLCNGQNTDREIRAFATLANIVSKNKRSKRRLVDVNRFISLSPRNKVLNEDNIIIITNETSHSAMQSDEPLDELIEIIQATSETNDDVHEEQVSENYVNNIIVEKNKVELDIESEMQGDQPIEMNDIAATTETFNQNVEKITSFENIETAIDHTKINSVTPSMAMLEENEDNRKHRVTTPEEFETQQTTETPTHTSMLPTSIEIELSVVHIQKPEALQENVTPVKVTTPTTMGTIEMSTVTNHIETTTHTIKEIAKQEVAKENNPTQDIKKNNGKNDQDIDEKNGTSLTLASLVWLIYTMNIMLCVIL